ncbi:tRNA (adenosine(37)-N6)-threonylcarbamoyltransferase complex ATPase subunit type 1 TsaE [Proteobacteria bacterium 005FR1]|nr:tRNA (adenosine(37)-N6)-threonylcarbamoyltransferase complex ATPase subunit type 1 TsaE [Proteobacteria bacterium 005FR1]
MTSEDSQHFNIDLANEAATVALGEALGQAIVEGGIVYLDGTLGAGKTTLSRGVLRHFGHQGAVKSPTYTLVEAYELNGRRIYHFDLYRLGDPEELEYMGIRDYFTPDAICLVEWPERGEGLLPAADLRVKVEVIHYNSAPRRRAQITAHTKTGSAMLRRLRIALKRVD